jgi:probable H4MPT-linked C1 transfer pathway protein
MDGPRDACAGLDKAASGATAVLGWDIGGANLKAVMLAVEGQAIQALCRPFPLWKQPDKLTETLAALVASFPPATVWAVTMTGELCDCFPSRREGVSAILDAVERVAGAIPVWVWTTTGQFVTPAVARQQALRVASANWHALATAAARRFAPRGSALLCDIGSTTTDLIPILEGQPCPYGWTDAERLRSHELVYRGVRRTPLCVLMPERTCAEWFATTLDLFLILGDLPADATDTNTADGRPATLPEAYARLARLFGTDSEMVHAEALLHLAAPLLQRLEQELTGALTQVCQQNDWVRWPDVILLSGSGEFLARRIIRRFIQMHPHQPPPLSVSLTEQLGSQLSAAAPAWAVAELARTAKVQSWAENRC